MKDFYAILKIQHGPLRQAMQSAGIKSPIELARLAGIGPSSVYNLLNFKEPPLNPKNGQWRDSVLKICHFLGFSPEELFPEHLRKVIASTRFETFASGTSLPATEEPKQLEPYSQIDQAELATMLGKALDTLNHRQKYVLTERYLNGKTLSEIAVKMSVGPERIRQIEAKALRRLRCPDVMNHGPLREAGCFLESSVA